MAAHLRVGSTVDVEYIGANSASVAARGVVSNLTDAYLEIEGHPALLGNAAISWSSITKVTITTD